MSLMLPLLLLAIAIGLVLRLLISWFEYASLAAELTGDDVTDAEILQRLIRRQGGGR